MNQTQIYIERKLELETSIKKLESQLSSMPEGTIVCYKHRIGNKKYPQFYKQIVANGKARRQYLSHKNTAETKILAHKLLLSKQLNTPAPKNELVRSKSEATIAYILYSHGIPYRYEEIHDIYGYSIATDFTVMHPKTGQIILGEHFGRCDDPSYQKTVDFKMYRYIRAGYLPGVNFITTYEDSKHLLDPMLVEEIVKKFFL